MNTLIIGNDFHFLDDVYLYLEAMSGNDNGLIVDLFADSQDLTRAGFAINCLALPNTTQISRSFFEFPSDVVYSEVNELGESVLCEPGGTLTFARLWLTFDSANNGFVDTSLEAICYKFGSENEISVYGEFEAQIVRREHANAYLQPSLFDA